MITIDKPSYNEEYRTMQFRRADGQGQLAAGEIVTAAEVVVTDRSTNADCTPEMIADVAPYDQTQVLYQLKGGEPGRTYFVSVRIITSRPQKLSETMLLKVTN